MNLRFLFVGSGYPGVEGADAGSGIGTYLREMTLGLLAQGHACDVLVWRTGPGPDRQTVGGVTIHLVSHVYWPLLERVAPDSRDVSCLWRATSALHGRNRYDWIEIESDEGIGIGIQRRWPSQCILRVHTTLKQMALHKRVSNSHALRWRLRREARSIQLAGRVLTHSPYHAGQVEAEFGLTRPPEVVLHGLDLAPGTTPRDWDFSSHPTFLLVGSADERKGFDRIRPLLDAYSRHCGCCEMVIVSSVAESLRREFGLVPPWPQGTRVRILSNVPTSELRSLYTEACAFVHLARYESFGLPLVEAAAVGTPVVATPTGIVPELLTDDLLPCVLMGDDVTDWARTLRWCAENRGCLGAAVQNRYRERFTRKHMTEAYLALLQMWSRG